MKLFQFFLNFFNFLSMISNLPERLEKRSKRRRQWLSLTDDLDISRGKETSTQKRARIMPQFLYFASECNSLSHCGSECMCYYEVDESQADDGLSNVLRNCSALLKELKFLLSTERDNKSRLEELRTELETNLELVNRQRCENLVATMTSLQENITDAIPMKSKQLEKSLKKRTYLDKTRNMEGMYLFTYVSLLLH